MYDQVVDTRKQLESLKHLLLKDITDDEKVILDVPTATPRQILCDVTASREILCDVTSDIV